MTINRRVLEMALRHTDDPELAARYAEQLNDPTVPPSVAFPAAWVLTHQKGSPEFAAYAVTHCDDPATLDAIARRARRVSVLCALARNLHTPDDAIEAITSYAEAKELSTVERALDKRAEILGRPALLQARFTRVMSSRAFGLLGEDALLELAAGLQETTGSTAQGRRLGEAILASGNTWLASRLLVKELFPDPDEEHTWASVTGLSGTQAVELLHVTKRARPFEEMIKAIQSTYHAPTPASPEIVASMLRYANVPDVYDVRRHWPSPSEAWMSPAGVALVVDNPAWYKCLPGHALTPEQYDRVLAGWTDAGLNAVLHLAFHHELGTAESRRRVEVIVDKHRAANARFTDLGSDIQDLLELCNGHDDPFLNKILSVIDVEALAGFISGNWDIKYKELVPTIEQVRPLLANLGELGTWEVRELVDECNKERLDWEYRRFLIEEMPGLAHFGVTMGLWSQENGRYIYQRLTSTTSNPDQALDAFTLNEKASLQRICAAQATLERLS
jgi:hypothetical protein